MVYEHTPDAAQILGRRTRFTDMLEKSKLEKRGVVQMVHTEKERRKWRLKRHLTDESLLHFGIHGPGCKIENSNFKDQKQKTQKTKTRRKHKGHKRTNRNVPGQ